MARNKFNRIDVLQYTDYKGEEHLFKKDSIVKVTTPGTFGTEYIGRIIIINTLSLTLDISNVYSSNIVELKYDNVGTIEMYTPIEAWVNVQRTEGLEI